MSDPRSEPAPCTFTKEIAGQLTLAYYNFSCSYVSCGVMDDEEPDAPGGDLGRPLARDGFRCNRRGCQAS